MGAHENDTKLFNDKRTKRKNLEEVLGITGDLFSDDDISLNIDEKKKLNKKRMNSSTKAKAMKEAELKRMMKKREEPQVIDSGSEESSEEEDLIDSDTEEISYDESEDDEDMLRATAEKAKSELGCKTLPGRERNEEARNEQFKKPESKMACGDDGRQSTLRRSLRVKEQNAGSRESDKEEDAFIQRLKEKELAGKIKVKKISSNGTSQLNPKSAEAPSSGSESTDSISGRMKKSSHLGAKAARKPTPRKNLLDVNRIEKSDGSPRVVPAGKKESSGIKMIPPKTQVKEKINSIGQSPARKWESTSSIPGGKPTESANAHIKGRQISRDQQIASSPPTVEMPPNKKTSSSASRKKSTVQRSSNAASEFDVRKESDVMSSLGRMTLRSGKKLETPAISDSLNSSTARMKN